MKTKHFTLTELLRTLRHIWAEANLVDNDLADGDFTESQIRGSQSERRQIGSDIYSFFIQYFSGQFPWHSRLLRDESLPLGQ